jgi:signal transduction histidine kinase
MGPTESQFPGTDPTLQGLPDGSAAALAAAARLAALGELTRGLVHAANNALFAILAHIELLRDDLGAATDVDERLRTMEDAGLQLRDTLRRLGELSQERGGAGPARLDEEVRELVELLRGLGLVQEIEASYPEDELHVVGPTADVGQIAAHALLHAVSLAGRSGRLAVEVRREGDAAVLRVDATGTPAPPPDRGLGLVVARALAARLGGSLEPAGEAALRLSLPLA